MKFIWRKIIWFIFGTLLSIASNAEAQVSRSESSTSDDIQTIDYSFNLRANAVKSQLLQAPEASLLYLQHWRDVYNTYVAKSKRVSFTFEDSKLKRPKDPKITNPDTAWKPNGSPIVSPEWANRTPLSFKNASIFRPDQPPGINSLEFQGDLESVFNVGEKYGEFRQADQSVSAAFWADGLGTITPPGRWNLIALQETQHLPEIERIQILLALNIALYDAGIAAWDSKYHYLYWRPTTAIIKQYPEHLDWQPMLEPPFHPEYVSGHSTFSGAAATILEAFLEAKPFCLSSEELLGLERCFDSFQNAAEEAGQSRIYGGIHFEFSNQAGLKLGEEVANQVLLRFADHFPTQIFK